jgi:hypothetical protein
VAARPPALPPATRRSPNPWQSERTISRRPAPPTYPGGRDVSNADPLRHQRFDGGALPRGARHDAWIVLISINFSDEGRDPADPEGGPAGEVEGEGLTRLIAELILNSVQ